MPSVGGSVWRGPQYPFRPGISKDVTTLQKQLDEIAQRWDQRWNELQQRLVTIESRQPIPGPRGKPGERGPQGPPGPSTDVSERVSNLESQVAEIVRLMELQRETTTQWDRQNKATQEALRLMAERIGQLGERPPVTVRFKDDAGNVIAESQTGKKGIANFRLSEIERLLNGGR